MVKKSQNLVNVVCERPLTKITLLATNTQNGLDIKICIRFVNNSLYSKVRLQDAQTLQSQFCGFKAPF